MRRDDAHLGLQRLMDTVVRGGYCIGCGVCAGVNDSPLEMRLGAQGVYLPVITRDCGTIGSDLESVCPFSDASIDEDSISRQFLPMAERHNSDIGAYLALYAGYVAEDSYREQGSSGGLGTWLAAEILQRELADYIIHIRPRGASCPSSEALFTYAISSTLAEVREGAKSRYYPIELSKVLRTVRERPGRYAVVGLPCFMKAIRLMSLRDAVVRERVSFTIGLVCGHLKSTRYLDLLAWQCGIAPGHVVSADFRHKLPGHPASRYGIQLSGIRDGQPTTLVRSVHGLLGADWGMGMLKNAACDFCDDVFSETAEVAIGDAWLPQYVGDWRGTNIVVVRDSRMLSLLLEGQSSGRIVLRNLDARMVAESQAGGLRHRREGLSYRIALKDQEGVWRPRKRVEADTCSPGAERRALYRLRSEITSRSHTAFERAVQEDSLELFRMEMAPLVRAYLRMYRPIHTRLLLRLKGMAEHIVRVARTKR